MSAQDQAPNAQTQQAQQSKGQEHRHHLSVGLALIVIGLLMLGYTFYEAILAYRSVGSTASFEKTFGGALSYLNSSSTSNGALGGLTPYMNMIIVLLIMAVFLGIALAAGSTILAKGVQLLSSR